MQISMAEQASPVHFDSQLPCDCSSLLSDTLASIQLNVGCA